VLERGRRWPIREDGDTFATFENLDGRCSWLSETTPIAFIESAFGLQPATFPPYTGVMEAIQGNGITILLGAGVGGGSLAYNAILVAPHRSVFEQIFPHETDFDSGAKQSGDHNYLAMTEATERVRILPLHEVVSIDQIAIGKRVFSPVSVDQITEQGELLRRRKFL
jgi:hypothetical protein